MMANAKESTAPNNQGTPLVEEKPLLQEIIQLNDDFREFSHISSFLAHALAASLEAHQWLDNDVISGGRLCSNWLQNRTSKLRDEMRHVTERYIDEQEEKA
jgi:hypothetical protein